MSDTSKPPLDLHTFFMLTKDSPPWPLVMRAVSLLEKRGRALDLGAGAGRDTRYLLTQGFQVTAVDQEPPAVELLKQLQQNIPEGHLTVVEASFETFVFETYDLISAQFALPFLPLPAFSAVVTQIRQALAPGGIFVGQFFGVNDQWNTGQSTITFLTSEEATQHVAGLDLIELREEDVDGHIADGSPKHWHVFHILARKPAG